MAVCAALQALLLVACRSLGLAQIAFGQTCDLICLGVVAAAGAWLMAILSASSRMTHAIVFFVLWLVAGAIYGTWFSMWWYDNWL